MISQPIEPPSYWKIHFRYMQCAKGQATTFGHKKGRVIPGPFRLHSFTSFVFNYYMLIG